MKAWTKSAATLMVAALMVVAPATGAAAASTAGAGVTPDYISICKHPIFKVLCFG